MQAIVETVQSLNEFLWGPFALIFLSLAAVYFLMGTKGVTIRYFFLIIKKTLGDSFNKDKENADEEVEGSISSAQSLFTALAATIGMGSIVGVASALIMGGPGAVLWMWVAAVLGMIIKYAEIILLMLYRRQTPDGSYVGGPGLYIKNGLQNFPMAIVIVVLGLLAILTSTMIQSNVVVKNIQTLLPFNLSSWVPSLLLVALLALVLIGGIERIGALTEKIVPFMSIAYLIGGIIVILINYDQIGSALALIFKGFYSPVAIGGGAAAYGIAKASQYGIARGFFVSGAGQAMFTVSHAPAKVDHPVEQAVYGITEIFLVTIICTVTALSILTSGAYSPDAAAATLTTEAFNAAIPGFGYFVSLSIVFFSFTTVLGFGYISQSQLSTITDSPKSKWILYLFLLFVFIGGMGGLTVMWEFTDFFLAIVMYINIVVMILLSRQIFQSSNEFWENSKNKE